MRRWVEAAVWRRRCGVPRWGSVFLGAFRCRARVHRRAADVVFLGCAALGLLLTGLLAAYLVGIAEKARLNERRFMEVLHASSDAILLIDGDQFVDCNDATARMLGYPRRRDFLMTHPSQLSPPTQPDGRSSYEKAAEMMETAFRHGFHRFEWMHRKANGEDFPVEVSLTSIVARGKNQLHCVWRDITEQKQTQQAAHNPNGGSPRSSTSCPTPLSSSTGRARSSPGTAPSRR